MRAALVIAISLLSSPVLAFWGDFYQGYDRSQHGQPPRQNNYWQAPPAQQRGNTMYFSDGRTATRSGNTWQFSDGRFCDVHGNNVHCY